MFPGELDKQCFLRFSGINNYFWRSCTNHPADSLLFQGSGHTKGRQDCHSGPELFQLGDLGVIDLENFIYIRGRCKNMLLGPSGQNIYPEEMEAKLSNYPYVLECVITEREGKMVAFVYPDPEMVEAEKPDENHLKGIMAENCKQVNKELPKFAQLSSIVLVDKEFEKTPKRNIKRYLYT